MRRFLILAVLSGLAGPAAAQAPPFLVPGHVIRIKMMDEAGAVVRGAEGVLQRVSPDSLTLRPLSGGPDQVFVASPQAAHLIRTGHRAYLVRGAVIGGFAGLLTGAIITMSKGRECADLDYLCPQREVPIVSRELLVAGIGATTGALIGLLRSHDVWTPWPAPPQARPVVSIGARGLELGLSLPF
jgi:hypothetical protein